MGRWSVSETGLNYLMEYTNGFKRSIRRSQVTKISQGATVTYASSQSPNLTLAEKNYYIQSYTSGTSTIDFTNNGGDDWEIGFKITPDSLQVPSGVTVDSIDYTISIWKLGVETNLDSQIVTTDASYNSVGNGAGVYASFVHYNLSDGSEFQVYRIDKVDGAGNIIASLELNGIVVNSISALTMNVTASVIQTGASYSVIWLELPTLTQVGTGGTANITVQNVSTSIGFTLDIDSVFTTDFQTSFGAVSTISIN